MNPGEKNADHAEVKTLSPLVEMGSSVSGTSEIRAWLDAFAAAVRAADYRAGERLFAHDVAGFGTVAVMFHDLDTLVESQWKRVWGVTSGFRFHMEHAAWGVDGDHAWVAAPWTSQGRTRDGRTFDRHGRATYVLERRDGHWLAVHSHHSLDPAPARD
jgi:ketosteroid isomerase-like protein